MMDKKTELKYPGKKIMKLAMLKFIKRVDAGEIKSTKLYNDFKKILGREK